MGNNNNDFLGLGTVSFTTTSTTGEIPPKEYATIKEVEEKLGRKIRWQPLRELSKDQEIVFVYVRDNDRYIKAYHADAWYGCYEINIVDLFV